MAVSGCTGGTCTAAGAAGCYYACQGNTAGTGGGANCVNSCTGCDEKCGGSCHSSTAPSSGGGGCGSCGSGCSGKCTNECTENCDALCTGESMTSINNLSLSRKFENENINDIYTALKYEADRRGNTLSSKTINEKEKLDHTFINSILTTLKNINHPTSVNSVQSQTKGMKALGEDIIDKIQDAWKEEVIPED